MMFNEATSGGISAGGCAFAGDLHPFITQFGVGDTLYSEPKARKGVLEKVVIKSIKTTLTRRTLVATTLYTDTFNGLWNEWDLVTYVKATELIELHRLRMEAALSRLRCR
jgi:hypothetical protein